MKKFVMENSVLYLYGIFSLVSICHSIYVEANVRVLGQTNKTVEEFYDIQAAFGPGISERGVWGYLNYTHPRNACAAVEPPPSNVNVTHWIALIERSFGNDACSFVTKVLHAQEAGYSAAIVHNVGADVLIPMGDDGFGEKVVIPSVFVSESDGIRLNEMYSYSASATHKYSIMLDPKEDVFNPNLYLVPFAVVVGVCFVLMVVFMLGRWINDMRKKRKNRLSKANLKKLPIQKFKKGESQYDTCAICLEDYEDGEKLRVLPCQHGYHQQCVDPWLTKNKRVCPVCKAKVFPKDRRRRRGSDSSESSSDDEEEGRNTASESTPLLSTASGGRGGSTFDNSGLPTSMRADVTIVNDTDSSSRSPNTTSSDSDLGDENPFSPLVQVCPAPKTAAPSGDCDESSAAPSSGEKVDMKMPVLADIVNLAFEEEEVKEKNEEVEEEGEHSEGPHRGSGGADIEVVFSAEEPKNDENEGEDARETQSKRENIV